LKPFWKIEVLKNNCRRKKKILKLAKPDYAIHFQAQVVQFISNLKPRNLFLRTSCAIYFESQAAQFISKPKPRNLFPSSSREIYSQSQARQY